MSLLKRLNGAEGTATLPHPLPDQQHPSPAPSGGPPQTTREFTGDLAPSGNGGTATKSSGEFPPRPPTSRLTTTLQEKQPRVDKQSGRPARKSDEFSELKTRVQNRLIAELDPRMDLSNAPEVKRTVEETFSTVLATEGVSLTRVDRARLFEAISAEILGFGPIEPLLRDPAVSEVMVNGPSQVYVEKSGKLVLSDVTFQDDDHVLRVIDRIVSPLGRRVDESSPTVDARLPDGSRVNAIIPPIALNGQTITIRKFAADPL